MRYNNPEYRNLNPDHRENLKFYINSLLWKNSLWTLSIIYKYT
jgi:hypothetical protein